MKLAGLGAGKVGLPWLLFLAEQGHDVVAYDTSSRVVEAINNKVSPIREPGVQEALETHDIYATTDLEEALEGTEMCFIYVPTPEVDKRLDGSIVREVYTQVCAWVKSANLSSPYSIVVCSTVMPGTMRSLWKLQYTGVDLFYVPPLIALGSALNDHRKAAVQYFGHGPNSPALKQVLAFYSSFWGRKLAVMSWLQAEVGKLMNNIMIAKRCEFAHEVTIVCEVLGIDPKPILQAIGGDPRFGSAFLSPGTPPDGPCIDRDVRAVKSWLDEQGAPSDKLCSTERWRDEEMLLLIDLAGEAEGDVLIIGSSYKALYYDDLSVPSFSRDVAETLRRFGYTVHSIPAFRTMGEAPEDASNYRLICLMQRDTPVVARWVRGLMQKESHLVYDPWRQL